MGFRQVKGNLNQDEVNLDQIKPGAYVAQKSYMQNEPFYTNKDKTVHALAITSSPLQIEYIRVFASIDKDTAGFQELIKRNKVDLEISKLKDLKLFHKLFEEMRPLPNLGPFEYQMVCILGYEDQNKEILGLNSNGQVYYQGKIYEGANEVFDWLKERIN